MKGLLLKDYYLIRSVLYIILAVFAVTGIGMSFLASAWVLTVMATVMLGMISVTTIQMDKHSGWRKISAVLPVSRKAVLDSKYILYIIELDFFSAEPACCSASFSVLRFLSARASPIMIPCCCMRASALPWHCSLEA